MKGYHQITITCHAYTGACMGFNTTVDVETDPAGFVLIDIDHLAGIPQLVVEEHRAARITHAPLLRGESLGRLGDESRGRSGDESRGRSGDESRGRLGDES